MGRGCAVGLLLFLVVSAGCARQRFHKSPWLVTERDAGRYVREALEHPSADCRRDAIVQLSKTRYADHDTVVDACVVAAKTDPSESVRVESIRVVAESLRSDAASCLIELVGGARTASSRMERVRLEAVNGLYFLERNGAVQEADRARAIDSARGLLRDSGEPRDLKIAAARLLGEFPSIDGVHALIGALTHEDFGVTYHAEQSLNRLTGVRHDYDAEAWRRWLESTDDPFVGRGRWETEPQAEPNWWQRAVGSVRRAFTGRQGGPSPRSGETR